MNTPFFNMQGYDVPIVGIAINKGEIVEEMKVLFDIPQSFLKIKPYDLIGHIVTTRLNPKHHATDTFRLRI